MLYRAWLVSLRDTVTMNRPKLNPPARGWQADLPEPSIVPNEEPALDGGEPNHLDEIYLELPRSYLYFRGVLVLIGLIGIPFSIWSVGGFLRILIM